MSKRIYLTELTVYNANIGGTQVLRYSNQGFTTGPAETPANTFYDARLRQPVSVTRDMFDAGATLGRSRVGYGDLILDNGDGELDALLNYAFDGRSLVIYYS